MRRFFFATLVALAGGGVMMPGYSLGAHKPARCASMAATPAERCHLDLNDRLKMDLGNWGNGIHPVGPNYFCVEHQRQIDAQNRVCR
jgi:hypothetical protein